MRKWTRIVSDKKEIVRRSPVYTDKKRIEMELKGLLIGEPGYDYRRKSSNDLS